MKERIDNSICAAFFTRMMAGTFGLTGSNNEAAAVERLLEMRPALNVFELAAVLRIEGASVMLEIPGKGYRRATRTPGNLNLDGQLIPIRSHPGLPMSVFGCPQCGADRYRLHEVSGIWACRKCHRLDYACRHQHRSIPSLHRLAWLRRRIGADPAPFTTLPWKPLHSRRHWRLAREIRALEARLIEHGQEIASVLENRHGR